MAAFNKFNAFVNDIASKVHNLGSDNLFVALSNVTPTATNAVLADITQIAASNGYLAGGNAATLVSSSQTSGLYTLKLTNVTFTASGGSMPTFQYSVLYNSTAGSKNLIGWFDYGATVTLTTGNSFTVQWDSVNGVLTLQ